MNNMQKDFKAKAKLDGKAMTMRAGYADGGQIFGPGTGTSDSVPIQASHGEYMLPADTVQAIGVGNLDAIKDATHDDVGMRAPGMFANGGLIDPDDPLQQVQSKNPSLRQAAPGIQQDPGSGVFQQDAVQNPGREIPRPAAPLEAPAVNVPTGGAPSTAADLRNFNRTYPIPPQAPSAAEAAPAAEVAPAAETAAPVSRLARLSSGVGDFARSAGKNLLKLDAPIAAVTTLGETVANGLSGNDTSTDDYAKRFGVSPPTGDGSVGDIAKFAGLRAGGFASDLGNNLTFGLAGKLFRDKQEQEASKPPVSVPTLRQGASTSGPSIASPDAAPQAQSGPAAEPALTPGNVNQNVANFQQQYGAAAQRAGDKLGVDPKLLLAQWGNETGWGKSVIPGTNNLGNIKDFSGAGVSARDNATGSNDKYKQFATPEDFADHYAGLVARKYPGAVGAGGDVGKFTQGLAGYAQDPQYGNKVSAAFNMINGVPNSAVAAAQANPNLRTPLRAQASWTNEPNIAEDGFNRDGTVQQISGTLRNGREAGSGAVYENRPGAPIDWDKAAIRQNFEAPAQRVQGEIENTRALREQNSLEHQRQAQQFAVTAAREQGAQDRANAADQQKRIQDASNQQQKDLQDRNTVTGADGKPTFDADAVGQQRQYTDRALAALAPHGVKSYADLGPDDKEKLLAGAKLLTKVQGEATNFPIPWKPDYLKTANPLDLTGMTRLSNGDAKMRNGQIIPSRFLNKEGSDRIGGKPTNEFNSLFAQGK